MRPIPKRLFEPEERYVVHHYLRLYQEDDKFKLEALSEPMEIESQEQYLKIEMYGKLRVNVHIYLDGVERDFDVLGPIQRKISIGLRQYFDANLYRYARYFL